MVLAFRHALRAHEVLRCFDALPGFFEVVRRLFEDGVLVSHRDRTKDALVEELGEALSAVSARDARGYFEHAGYRPVAQPL